MDYDGTAATDTNQRLHDLIFGVPGGCERCLPRRVPAHYEVWITTWDLQAITGGDYEYPHSWRYDLCEDCLIARRQLDLEEPGDDMIACVQDLPRKS